MLVKGQETNRGAVEIVSLEDLVPQNHLLRKIDAAVDFSRLYEFVNELYCARALTLWCCLKLCLFSISTAFHRCDALWMK